MRFREIGVGALLAAVVLAAHGGALNGGFHYDDRSIQENPAIRTWEPRFYFTSPLAVSGEPDASGYRPVTIATFAINYALGRLDPFGYLLVNLLLHLIVSWMVYVVGRRLLGDHRSAIFAGVLFALHPINAEAVNYVVARSSLLATLGALVAFWMFLRARDGGGMSWLVGGAAAFAGGLLSKESAVALIPPLLVFGMLERDGVKLSGQDRMLRVIRGLPSTLLFLVVVVGYVLVWWSIAGTKIEPRGAAAEYPVWTFAELVVRSLILWVWPWPLGLDHPLTFVDRFDVMSAAVVIVAGVGILGSAAVCWRRAPFLAWALIWVLAGLVPLAPLPWMTVKALFQENRLTFSAVGLAWLTATALSAGASAVSLKGGIFRIGVYPVRIGGVVGASMGIALVVGAVVVDRARSAVWSDDVALWHEMLRQSPESRMAYLNLGTAYVGRGEYDRAEAAYRRALEISPDYARAYYALGLLAIRRERYAAAEQFLRTTIALAPEYSGSYDALGKVAMKRKRSDVAMAALRRAVELNPRDGGAYARLGLLTQQAGDDDAAMDFYRTAVRVDPSNILARNNLGTIYLNRRDWSAALEQFTAAVSHDPVDVDVALNRAVALNALGRKEEARTAAEALLRDLPPDARFDAHRWAAKAILGEGRS